MGQLFLLVWVIHIYFICPSPLTNFFACVLFGLFWIPFLFCRFYNGVVKSFDISSKKHKVSSREMSSACFTYSFGLSKALPMLEFFFGYCFIFRHLHFIFFCFGTQVVYDDGDVEKLLLRNEKWEFIDGVCPCSLMPLSVLFHPFLIYLLSCRSKTTILMHHLICM